MRTGVSVPQSTGLLPSVPGYQGCHSLHTQGPPPQVASCSPLDWQVLAGFLKALMCCEALSTGIGGWWREVRPHVQPEGLTVLVCREVNRFSKSYLKMLPPCFVSMCSSLFQGTYLAPTGCRCPDKGSGEEALAEYRMCLFISGMLLHSWNLKCPLKDRCGKFGP